MAKAMAAFQEAYGSVHAYFIQKCLLSIDEVEQLKTSLAD